MFRNRWVSPWIWMLSLCLAPSRIRSCAFCICAIRCRLFHCGEWFRRISNVKSQHHSYVDSVLVLFHGISMMRLRSVVVFVFECLQGINRSATFSVRFSAMEYFIFTTFFSIVGMSDDSSWWKNACGWFYVVVCSYWSNLEYMPRWLIQIQCSSECSNSTNTKWIVN